MERQKLYLQKLVTSKDTKGVKTHKIKTKPKASSLWCCKDTIWVLNCSDFSNELKNTPLETLS